VRYFARRTLDAVERHVADTETEAHVKRVREIIRNAGSAGVTKSERYQLQYKLDRKLSDVDYVFGRLAWDKDRFSGFDHKSSVTGGYGRILMDNDRHFLKGELGAGYRSEELDDGTTNDNAIVLGNGEYRYKFSETSDFTQTLITEIGKDNTFVESVTKVRANIVGRLAGALSYTVKHNTDPPPINKKTDTFTAISLEYSF
jgi:putative salt-induced outer membrane protein